MSLSRGSLSGGSQSGDLCVGGLCQGEGVIVHGVSVWWFLSRVSLSRGSLSRRSQSGGLCLGVYVQGRRSLCRGLCQGEGVIVHGVSVWWFLPRRVFIRVSLSRGYLSRGSLS